MKKAIQPKALIAAILIIMISGFSGCERIKEAYSKAKGGKLGGSQPAASSDPANPDAPASGAPVPAVPTGPVFAVNTTTAAKGAIQDYLALSGDIISSSSVDTFSDAAGKISKLYVSVGNWVRKGDPVAEVDPSRPGMEFVASVVKAPVSGTVIALPAQLGMTINQAVPLARISGGTGLEIQLYVAERFISRIRLNQSCEITLDAWPGETFRGNVSEISPTVDTVSRTMAIKVSVENPRSKLKAGMFAKVRIITERKDGVVKIPVSAVINRFGEQFVFTVDYSNPSAPVAKRQHVIPGIIIDGVMEVQEGLVPDEEVVIRGQTLLDDGSRINIIERVAPIGIAPAGVAPAGAAALSAN